MHVILCINFMYNFIMSIFLCAHAHAQLCPTLCDPRDYSPPGSSVHALFQARILEGVAISYTRGSSRLRDQTEPAFPALGGGFFTTLPPFFIQF